MDVQSPLKIQQKKRKKKEKGRIVSFWGLMETGIDDHSSHMSIEGHSKAALAWKQVMLSLAFTSLRNKVSNNLGMKINTKIDNYDV